MDRRHQERLRSSGRGQDYLNYESAAEKAAFSSMLA